MNLAHLYSPALLPREKILSEGIETVRTEDLWSVILGNGSEKLPVKLLAKQIHQKVFSVKKLGLAELRKIKGVGIAKACQVMAVVELVERLRPEGYPLLNSLEKALTQVGELRYATREQVVCLYLNARLQLVLKETLSVGSVNSAVLTPRDIFGVIKHHPVTHLILAHNHPSGDTQPSISDLDLTHRIVVAGKILGVELLDHIIVARDAHFSCKAAGLLTGREKSVRDQVSSVSTT